MGGKRRNNISVRYAFCGAYGDRERMCIMNTFFFFFDKWSTFSLSFFVFASWISALTFLTLAHLVLLKRIELDDWIKALTDGILTSFTISFILLQTTIRLGCLDSVFDSMVRVFQDGLFMSLVSVCRKGTVKTEVAPTVSTPQGHITRPRTVPSYWTCLYLDLTPSSYALSFLVGVFKISFALLRPVLNGGLLSLLIHDATPCGSSQDGASLPRASCQRGKFYWRWKDLAFSKHFFSAKRQNRLTKWNMKKWYRK